MDVLIKNIPYVPKNCLVCPFLYLGSGGLCYFTECRCLKTKRPNGCPLVEVKPHGRLIDADALLDKAYLVQGVDGRMRTIVELSDIEEAPTVLEASE